MTDNNGSSYSVLNLHDIGFPKKQPTTIHRQHVILGIYVNTGKNLKYVPYFRPIEEIDFGAANSSQQASRQASKQESVRSNFLIVSSIG